MKQLLYLVLFFIFSTQNLEICISAELIVKIGHTGSVNSIDFSPDGTCLVSGGEDNTIRLWDLKSCEWTKLFKGHEGAVKAVRFSSDGKLIFSGSNDGTAKIWDIENGGVIRTFKGHSGPILDIAIKDSLLLTASKDRKVKIWSISTGICIGTMSHSGLAYSVCVKPGPNFIAASGTAEMTETSELKTTLFSKVTTSSPVGRIKVWTLAPPNNKGTYDMGSKIKAQEPMSFEYDLSYSLDGKYIISGTGVGNIEIWNSSNYELIRQIKHCEKPIFSIATSPDSSYIASAAGDGKIKIWNIKTGDLAKEIDVKIIGSFRTVSYSPDGHHLAFGGDNNNIYVWNIDSSKIEFTMKGEKCGVTSIDYSPDKKLIASGYEDNTIEIWNAITGELRSVFKHSKQTDTTLALLKRFEELISLLSSHLNGVTSIQFSPDGTYLVSSGYYPAIIFWDMKNNIQTKSIAEKEAINSISFHPNGKLLSTASKGEFMSAPGIKMEAGNTLKTWNVETLIMTNRWFEGSAFSTQFSSDSSYLAFGIENKDRSSLGYPYSTDGTGHVLVFDLNNQYKTKKLGGFKLKVCSVSFSKDGNYLGASDADGRVQIWEIAKWKNKFKIDAHNAQINSITLSPDSKYFVTGGQDGLIKQWSMESGKLIREINFHNGPIKSVMFSPSGNILFSASLDGSICAWDTESGNMKIRFFSFRPNLYISYTNEGYFRCSDNAEQFIHFEDGDVIYKLSDYKQKFNWENHPDKVKVTIN